MDDATNKEVCPHCGERHQEERFDTKEELVQFMATMMTKDMFEDLWKHQKKELKALPKKELAQEIFFQAAAQILHNTIPNKEDLEKLQRGA
jgi:hypothetical protein